MLRQFVQSIFICLILLITSSSSASGSVLSPGLTDIIEKNQSDSVFTVLIILDNDNQKNGQNFNAALSTKNRSEKIKSVISYLTSYKSDSQSDIHDFLKERSKSDIIKHWIVPAFTAELSTADIALLSQQPGISRIVENIQLSFDSPVKSAPAPISASVAVSNELTMMNIPTLWNRGLKGTGRLVCSFDTGVDGVHPALASKWRGNNSSLESSWFSKVAPDSLPYDVTGHGTHTMGVMVGAMDADSFGVAPEAEWISAGVIDQGRSLSMTISDIIEAFQWALNPDGDTTTTDDVPDVILNSWGIPKGLFFPCDDTFWGVIDNVEAAGVVTIFAAGNEGPEPMTLRSPADRASTALNSFCVGAVNHNMEVAGFSSRGPSSCNPSQIKPEVVAPGVNIRSSTKGGGFMYMSGTSMAAPYIAGIVALIRQYNPEATVEQIKNAFIQSAIDLGTDGDDNGYGHGFVDVANILNYIPSPYQPEFIIQSTSFAGNTYIMPGESSELNITLLNPVGNVSSTTGQIQAFNKSGVIIENDISNFFFGIGGTIAQNSVPYELTFDSSFYHGQELEFNLIITPQNGLAIDTIAFTLTVGLPAGGEVAGHTNSKLQVSVSDFGQFGFAPGSIYNLNGDGFSFNGSGNLLYESGLVVGRSALQMSTSIRDENGNFKATDFSPVVSLSDSEISYEGGESRTAVFKDINSEIQIPIEISQETIHYNNPGEEGILVVSYSVTNKTIESITGLYFGQLHDFTLSDNDMIEYDELLSLLYQRNSSNMFVGVVNLKNISTFKVFDNADTKIGFSKSELMVLLSDNNNSINDTISGDLMFLSSTSRFNLSPGESYEAVYAYVCGNSLNELYDNAVLAKEKYDLATDIKDNFAGQLPDNFILNQNYPNPFNPTTTISFQLAKTSDVNLEIFNVLGRKVKTLHNGQLHSGEHKFEWDATDNNEQQVASGIYFYRLDDGTHSASQKMTLLK